MRRDITTSITNKAAGLPASDLGPDGRHLVFGAYSGGMGELWWRGATGSGTAQTDRWKEQSDSLLLLAGRKRLAYTMESPGNSADLWTLSLDLRDPENPKAGTPEPFLQSPQAEIEPIFRRMESGSLTVRRNRAA